MTAWQSGDGCAGSLAENETALSYRLDGEKEKSMNESIRFYVLRNGAIFARVASYQDAIDIARLHQKTELASRAEAHYTIIKGCEQSVEYTS